MVSQIRFFAGIALSLLRYTASRALDATINFHERLRLG